MAKTLSRSAAASLYEDDVHLWGEREDSGANLRDMACSRTQQINRHLVKLQYSEAAESRRVWPQTIRDQRDELEPQLTTSLRSVIQATKETRYARARRRAAEDLIDFDQLAENLPEACPYSLEQVLSQDCFPAHAHGLKE